MEIPPQPKPVKEISWSHSSLDQYTTCPHRYARQRVTRDAIDKGESPALKWGNDVHKAIEDNLLTGRKMPSNMEQYAIWPARVHAMMEQVPGMEKRVEVEMCTTAEWKPTAWFGKNSWFRAKADVLLLNTTSHYAVNIDWKTNKRYYGESGQAERNAAMTLLRHDHLNEVETMFVYMNIDKVVSRRFTRAELPQLLAPSLQTLQAISHSYETGHWPKKKGFGCRFCPVKDCEFAGG